MKISAKVVAVGVLSVVAVCVAADKPEKTMQVARCQAVDEKGVQCKYSADAGKEYCWRHRGFVKSMNDAANDTSKGASKSWESTKQWSTNAWQKTKAGAQSAWDSTKAAADEARVGIVELFGGKDAKGGKTAK